MLVHVLDSLKHGVFSLPTKVSDNLPLMEFSMALGSAIKKIQFLFFLKPCRLCNLFVTHVV